MAKKFDNFYLFIILLFYFLLSGCTEREAIEGNEFSIMDHKRGLLCQKASYLESTEFFLENYTCLLQLLYDEPCLKLNKTKFEKFIRLTFLDSDYSVDILSIKSNNECFLEYLKIIPSNLFSISSYYYNDDYMPGGVIKYTKQSIVANADRYNEIKSLKTYFFEQEWNFDPFPPSRLWMLEILSDGDLFTGYADSDNLPDSIQSILSHFLGFSTVYSFEPNPFQGKVTFLYNLKSDGKVWVEVSNQSNKEIVDKIVFDGKKGLNQADMNLGNLSDGYYSVRMFFNDEIFGAFTIRKE